MTQSMSWFKKIIRNLFYWLFESISEIYKWNSWDIKLINKTEFKLWSK